MLQSLHTKTKALMLAGLMGIVMLLTMLSTAGATELHDAAKDGDIARIERLLKAGANADAKDNFGITSLHFAAGNGHNEVITSLLEAGADPNVKAKWGFTPLHRATENGHEEAITILLEAGANLKIKDRRRRYRP